MALDEINAKGGILGRPVELVVEDSTSGDAGRAVQKARKLIDGDKVDFLLGNVNSALALAMAQVSNEKGMLHIVPGGHTDAVTGASCHWNVFRVCNTTQMEANAVASALIKDYGKKFYYITPDYAYGHTLEAGLIKASAALGGERVGGDLTPLGTVDFSSYLIKAQAANPDVILFLVGGRRHGERAEAGGAVRPATSKVHLAGAQQELEPLEGLPPEARIGDLGDGMVLEAARRAACRRIRRRDQEAHGQACRRRAPGSAIVAVWTCALAAASAKSLDAVDDGEGAAGLQLPPEIALSPNTAFYRAVKTSSSPVALRRRRPGERRRRRTTSSR